MIKLIKSSRMVDYLAQIPLDVFVREGGDQGRPVIVSRPDSAAAALMKLSQVTARRLAVINRRKPVSFAADPLLKII